MQMGYDLTDPAASGQEIFSHPSFHVERVSRPVPRQARSSSGRGSAKRAWRPVLRRSRRGGIARRVGIAALRLPSGQPSVGYLRFAAIPVHLTSAGEGLGFQRRFSQLRSACADGPRFPGCNPTHSLTPSLPHSLTPSLHHSLTPSLPHSLTPSLPHSSPRPLAPSPQRFLST